MTMDIIAAHAGADCAKECADTWGEQPTWCDGTEGILPAYQRGLRLSSAPVLAFIHDDVRIDDADWQERVLREFEDETVGLVGFGGALQHGSDDLYRTPYQLIQLGRTGYRSNVDDAEVHGERFTGSCDVAVLDGFALIVRRSILQRAGGWLLATPVGYIGYDYWLACMARRFGYRIRMVGVRCHHLGGRTVVALKKGVATAAQYEAAHEYLWREFADVLPWRAEERA